jgi:hypothetical protein
VSNQSESSSSDSADRLGWPWSAASLLISGVSAFALVFVVTNGSGVALPCLAGFMAAALSVAISRAWVAGHALRPVRELARFVPGIIGLAATYALTSTTEQWIKSHMAPGVSVTLDATAFSVTRVAVISLVFGSCLAISAAATVAAHRWAERSQST